MIIFIFKVRPKIIGMENRSAIGTQSVKAFSNEREKKEKKRKDKLIKIKITTKQ